MNGKMTSHFCVIDGSLGARHQLTVIDYIQLHDYEYYYEQSNRDANQ